MTSNLGSEFLLKQPGNEDTLAEGNVLTFNGKVPKTAEIAQFAVIPRRKLNCRQKSPKAPLRKCAASLRTAKLRACSPVADLPHAG